MSDRPPGTGAPEPPDAGPPEPPDTGPPEPPDAVPPESASAERTRLSWRRTTLAATVTPLLTVRLAVRDGWNPLAALAIAAAMIGWLGQLWLTHRRIQAMAHREPAAIGRTLPATALLACAAGIVGVILTLVYPPR